MCAKLKRPCWGHWIIPEIIRISRLSLRVLIWLSTVFTLILIDYAGGGVHAWQFNCDPVNQAQFCLCTKGDSGASSWDIACPAKILEVYPVTLKSK